MAINKFGKNTKFNWLLTSAQRSAKVKALHTISDRDDFCSFSTVTN